MLYKTHIFYLLILIIKKLLYSIILSILTKHLDIVLFSFQSSDIIYTY